MAKQATRARQANSDDKMTRASIFLAPDLHRTLRITAAERNISVSRLVMEALEAHFGTKKRKTSIARTAH